MMEVIQKAFGNYSCLFFLQNNCLPSWWWLSVCGIPGYSQGIWLGACPYIWYSCHGLGQDSRYCHCPKSACKYICIFCCHYCYCYIVSLLMAKVNNVYIVIHHIYIQMERSKKVRSVLFSGIASNMKFSDVLTISLMYKSLFPIR